jgi:hypothetical protein
MNITMLGTVLWQQGKELAVQPLIDPAGNILLWNGDVFGGVEVGNLLFAVLPKLGFTL